MSLSAISNSAVSARRLERHFKNVQSEIWMSSNQVGREKKDQYFYEMDIDKIEISNGLENSILSKEHMMKLNQLLKYELREYSASMNQILKIATKTDAVTSDRNRPTLIKETIDELVLRLGTIYKGQYLYSGSKTDTFQKFFGALHILKGNSMDLAKAKKLLDEVKAELSEKISLLNQKEAQVQNQINCDEDHILELKERYEKITSVDHLLELPKIYRNQTKMLILYKIINASDNMSYINYMR